MSSPVMCAKSSSRSSMVGCYKWCAIGTQLCRCKAFSSGDVYASLCVCWGIIQTQIYNIFLGTELHFKCSSGFIRKKCNWLLYTFENIGTIVLFPNRVTWDRDRGGNTCSQKRVRFLLCNLPSCSVRFHPAVPATNPFFSDVSIHLWDDLSLQSFNLLLFWAQLLQKCIYLLSSSTAIKSL